MVVRGDRRGRELGFPTANLVPPDGVACPGHGVYACLANGLPAAVTIGVRPTFGTGRAELIEAYLLDFDGDLYGHELRLRFLERLRGERRFETVEALIEAMHATSSAPARSATSASRSQPSMTLTSERKRELDRAVRRQRARHRQHEGPDRPADRADQRAHRAPARAQAATTTRVAAC